MIRSIRFKRRGVNINIADAGIAAYGAAVSARDIANEHALVSIEHTLYIDGAAATSANVIVIIGIRKEFCKIILKRGIISIEPTRLGNVNGAAAVRRAIREKAIVRV